MIIGMSVPQIIKNLKETKRLCGKSIIGQISEIYHLRLGKGKLSAKEYYDYRLFDSAFTFEHKKTFVGAWAKGDVYMAQDPQWYGVGNDKALSYLLLQSFGLPVPPLKAIYQTRRFHPGVRLLKTPEDFENWLRDAGNYPFFAKPVAGAFGLDSCYGEAFDPATDSIVTISGEHLPVSDFVKRRGGKDVGGLLLQDIITPHPDITTRIGRRVATARIVTIASDEDIRIHRAAFRIPVGRNVTDNFNLGAGGNGFANIDIETGTLSEMYVGLGLSLQKTDKHVDTGETIKGFQLPDWQRALDIVRLGQSALFGLPILGWDIAFTPTGPVVVEFNTHPGYAMLQASGSGFADAEFRRFFPASPEECRKKYPHILIGTGGRPRY
jgi:hypothetical protein